MTKRKERLTVTVNPELVVAANEAVVAGLADSVSGWVNDALAANAQEDRRIRAMSEAIAAYEAEFGEITAAEIVDQQRADREAAIVIRAASPIRRIRRPPDPVGAPHAWFSTPEH